jgi:ubiquinone/menaquinone biosynthesis C-methylase UbiE
MEDVTSCLGNDPQDYQQQRYRSLDQAWVNWREQHLLAQLLTQCQLARGTMLDVPCGYSRFAPLYARLGITAIGADVSYDMAHLAAASHARHGWKRWLCANALALPFIDSVFDSVLCIRLLHHRYSDAERQRILCELARVSRRFVIISFYRPTLLHTMARRWRGSRGRLAMMTLPHLRELAQASGLQIQRVQSLLRFCHAQTFVVLTKIPSAGNRLRLDSQCDALSSPAALAVQRTDRHH